MKAKKQFLRSKGVIILFSIAFALLFTFQLPKEGEQVSAASSCSNLANWQCVETRPGLSLCRANNICVVKVDLNNSSLRPKVVIAPNGGTDWLSSMGSREGAYAAINGDYFSGCPDTNSPYNCGEGLTFVNGTDYTDYTGSEWQNRRSLGFNDNFDPNIGRPGEQGGYHRQLLGGGPQITFGGEYRWRCWYQGYNTDGNCTCQNNTVVINDELFGCSANNWWNRPQTFIGFSEDRNTLYLAVSEPGYNKTPHDMHDVLWVQGARYTLKMDGGGSSGMYYNDGSYQFSWNGGRAVANAWVIIPNNDPPPPPPQCNPNADQVALYADSNYSGTCKVLGIGEYNNPGAMGFPNDAASSIKVGSNVKAILYEHDDYNGISETFESDDSDFGNNAIGHDRVSSIKVQSKGGSCTNGATPGPLQTGYTYCANEGGMCTFSGQASVAYGANNCFTYKTFTSSAACNNTTFTDPIVGTGKACYYKITSTTKRNVSRSQAFYDGWIMESGEFSNKGGTLNSSATTFVLGDNAQDRQYRAILSFNTTGLPDNAVITKVTLKIRKQGLVGTNPFTTHSGLKVDIRRGKFGNSAKLQSTDFQALASKNAVGTFSKSPKYNWYSANLNSVAYPYINLTGITQFRLRFAKDDNDDMGADYMKFFSSNITTISYRPQLIIEYYVP